MARWRRWASRPAAKLMKVLAEVTLALVLFSDASRVGLRELRADLRACACGCSGIGLPLTIGLGTLLAFALRRRASIWLALLVGAALAPTDAALGAGMMVNPAVPARIRRLINVESGLNDGIATPFVSGRPGRRGHRRARRRHRARARPSPNWLWAC